MFAELICVKGPYTGQKFPIGAGGLVIGRDPESASIVLDRPSVSRSHANVFVSSDGRVVVQDLGSTNGTWTLGGAGEKKKISSEAVISDRGRFFVGEGEDCVFEVVYMSRPHGDEVVAPAFAAPAPQTPVVLPLVLVRDTWSNGLRIFAKVLFVLAVLGGISLGYKAYQAFSINPMLMEYRLQVFLGTVVTVTISAFFCALFLNMAADIREVHNSLDKR
jgi:hypothetical protein